MGVPLTEIASVSPKRERTGYLNTFAVLVFAASAVVGILFVRRYAVNTIYWDQFADLNVIQHAHSGTLSFGLLWAQHNENRVLFPNLIVLALAYTTHFNIVDEEFLSLVLWCLTIGLIIVAHKRRSPGMSLIFYCPVVVVALSFTPLWAILFGYRMSWFLALLGLGMALFLLDRVELSRLALIRSDSRGGRRELLRIPGVVHLARWAGAPVSPASHQGCDGTLDRVCGRDRSSVLYQLRFHCLRRIRFRVLPFQSSAGELVVLLLFDRQRHQHRLRPRSNRRRLPRPPSRSAYLRNCNLGRDPGRPWRSNWR